jgi:hypothetical protein
MNENFEPHNDDSDDIQYKGAYVAVGESFIQKKKDDNNEDPAKPTRYRSRIGRRRQPSVMSQALFST